MSDSPANTTRSIFLILGILAVAAMSTCEKYPKTVLIQTGTIDAITAVSAIIEGVIVDPGDGIKQYGHCWSLASENPTADLPTSTKKGSSESKGYFPSQLSGLTPDTLYYVRAYAITDDGSVYGKTEYFRTPAQKPEAGFKASKSHIAVNIPVVFTDESKNDPTEWKWDFGDGSTSPDQNSSHSYKTAGRYNVTLIVANESGSDTLVKPDYITAGHPPFPNFYASKTNPHAGESVQFYDQSIQSPTSWEWDFGDDGTSLVQNPTHSFNTEGTYTITLTVTNDFGSNTQAKPDYITVDQSSAPPVAQFTSNTTRLRENGTVSFSDQSSNNPTTWEWDFGDGTTSPAQNPNHKYEAAGKYTVALRASNSYGSHEEVKPDVITVVVVDIEFNEYEAVQLGNQIWMAENLKVKYYSDGTAIPHVPDPDDWNALFVNDKAYSYQDNLLENLNTYGGLYTWAAAMNGAPGSDENPSGVQGVCPSGWHLPSDQEWMELEQYLGMSTTEREKVQTFRGTNQGELLKATDTIFWNVPNYASNISGFSALGAGGRVNGEYVNFKRVTIFYTSTDDSFQSYYRGLKHSERGIRRELYDKRSGFSVRCVKD